LSISIREIALERTAGGCVPASGDLALQSHQALWITNPVWQGLSPRSELRASSANSGFGVIVVADDRCAQADRDCASSAAMKTSSASRC
jgi:hypothetical protein